MRVEDEIRDFLMQSMGQAHETVELSDSLPLIDTGVVDSMGMLELILWLEQRYGIGVRDEDVLPVNFGTISAIASYVSSASTADVTQD